MMWIPDKKFQAWRKRGVTPECFYHLLLRHPSDFRAAFSLPLNVFIAPYSSPRQSLSRGPQYLSNWIPR